MTWLEQNALFLSLPTQQLLALVAYGEAATEGGAGLMAVINVIANRTKDSQFIDSSISAATGDKYKAVILKPCQFSCFNSGIITACPKLDPQRAKLTSLAQTFSSSVMTNTALNQAYQLSGMLLMGTLADNTSGATHYHTAAVSPSWAPTMTMIGSIGNHIFYTVYPAWKRVREVVEASPIATAIIIGIIGFATFYILRKRRAR